MDCCFKPQDGEEWITELVYQERMEIASYEFLKSTFWSTELKFYIDLGKSKSQ